MSTLPDQNMNPGADAANPAGGESMEDVIKSLVNFSQVVSKTLCSLQKNIANLTGVVELQAKEIAELRESSIHQSQNTRENTGVGGEFDPDDESQEYEELLNKMQMRRSTMTYPVNTPASSKKESDVSNAKATILAAARESATTAAAE